MSRPQTRHRKGPTPPRAERRRNDRGVYIGFVIIGLAVVGFGWLLSHEHWRGVTLGYLIAMAWLVNFYAVQAYRGKRLALWQQALARLPLRCVGFGTRAGKPLEAAHAAESAKTMILVSIAVSVLLLAGVSFLLFPGVVTGA